MIDWCKSFDLFGTAENSVTKKSKVWFVCDNCGSEYKTSYKTTLERKRCGRTKCKFCTNRTLTDEQRENRRNGRYYTKRCRDRQSLAHKKKLNSYYLKSWRAFITRRVHTIEDKHKSCDITVDYIEEMLKNQDCRCSISGIDLTHFKSLNDMSIDRIDNDLGHTKENVQIICRGLNIAKNRHTNCDIIYFLDCLCGVSVFVPSRFSRDYISSVRRNSHQRDRSKGFVSDLTTDNVIKIFESQNGLCAISGLPMAAYKHPIFSVSVDRIDNGLGHTIDNIHLVLKAINRAKSVFTVEQVVEWLDNVRSCYGKYG